MFFPATINAAEKTIVRRSPNRALRREGMYPGPHLLWLCDQIRELAADQQANEAKAQEMVLELSRGINGQHWWEASVFGRLLDLDERHGFNKVHPRQCLAIDFRHVIRIEDERRFTPNVFDAIGMLVAERFGHDVYIMFRARPASPNGHHHFLEKEGFFEKTGVRPDHLVCYKTRPETAAQCRRLGITHYISSRIEVLNYAEGARSLIAFNADATEGVPIAEGKEISRASSWKQVKDLLLGPKMVL
jgi:hypothetical protein